MIQITDSRARLGVLALAATGIVVASIVLQRLMHLAPCPLCIFQRMLYMGIAAVALFTWMLSNPRHRQVGLGLIAGASLLGLGVATYQTLMERFPQAIEGCGLTDPTLIERIVDWAATISPDLFMATGFCGSIEWSVLGLSLANGSVACFLAMALLTLTRPHG